MIYLESFTLVSEDDEWEFLRRKTRKQYPSYYPFQIFPRDKELSELSFSDITILCGGNGSGKSTLLNIIAESLELRREASFNKSDLFDAYVERCSSEMWEFDPEKQRALLSISKIITSDDVFKHIIGVREKNQNINFKRELIRSEKESMKSNGWQGPRGFGVDDPKSVAAYSDYCEKVKRTTSDYIHHAGYIEERTYSNGENGFKYFTDSIQPGGLYLLDEPENSLSAEMQIELAHYLHGMAGRYDCQFIISTHSPFLLSMPAVRIYNMDVAPVGTCKWTELPSVRTYYEFFKANEAEFD